MAEGAAGGAAGTAAGGGGTAGAAAAAGAGAASAQPAAGASSAQAGGAGAGTQAAADWTTGFDDDSRGYVGTKGFKTPTDLLTSYRNLEKLNGAPEKLLKIPDSDADTAAWDSIHTRLGRPADAKGYKIQAEKGQEEFAGWLGESFFKANLTEKQAKAFGEAWNARAAAQNQTRADAAKERFTTQQAELKKEWGAAFEQNLSVFKRAVRDLGMEKHIGAIEEAMGHNEAAKFFHRLGIGNLEPGFVSGGRSGSNSIPAPAQAKSQIAALKADPAWAKRYFDGGAAERAEMQRLHQFAYPDQTA